jgi:aldose 1-epimerase
MAAAVVELPSVSIDAPYDSGPDGTITTIRQFRLTLGDVTVELSSLGASIMKVLLPRERKPDEDDNACDYKDDVVLSYASPKEQYSDRNRPYFGCIVGRVANRIKDGRFSLRQQSSSSDASSTIESYQLETNNGPNHLHGGYDGFSNRIWDASIVDNDTTVRFTLVSPDGDQGYPAGIEVVASYSLVPIVRRDIDAGDNNTNEGATLRLVMTASLLPGETKATPIGLAQHSYFNLSSHNSSKSRLNDHDLHMPNCLSYTPVDSTSIPTREVRHVDVSHDKAMSSQPLAMRLMYRSLNTQSAMDFRTKRDLADVLHRYGVDQVGLPLEEAAMNLVLEEEGIALVPEGGGAMGSNLAGNAPYGFDHNYIIESSSEEESDDGMRLAASLFHDRTSRSLNVYTTAPGVQVYTANYLDGKSPAPELCKDGATYRQWQGICLETQTFPDSILLDDDELVKNDDAFAKGRCFVLRPGGENYYHAVEYEFRI